MTLSHHFEHAAPEVDPDDFEVCANDVERLTEQSQELQGKRKELTAVNEDVEAELTDLRSKIVLGKATPAEQMRREVLLERSTAQAADLRELNRLIKLTGKGLQRAERLAAHEVAQALAAKEQRLSALARELLPGAAQEVLEASARYCATWALAERSKSYLAAKPARAGGSYNARDLEPLVSKMMVQLEEELA